MPRTTPFNKGTRFGRLVVETDEGSGRWGVRCDCGAQKIVFAYNLIAGKNKSCGCLLREKSAERARLRNTSHGLSRSREYRIWGGMMTRCYNENDAAYPRYGGRGITVCKRWHKFENFLADMGPAPAGHSLDRRDNDKEYKKSNCRWALSITQNNNKSTNVFLTFKNKTLSCSDWDRLLQYPRGTVTKRRLAGWDVQRILTTPIRRYRS